MHTHLHPLMKPDRITELPPRLLDQVFHLRPTPPLIATKERHRRRLEPMQQIHLSPRAQHLLMPVLGPVADRPTITGVLDVDEAGFFELGREEARGVGVDAGFAGGGHDAVAPAAERDAGFRRGRGRVRGQVEFLHFEVAARLQVGEALAEEPGPGFEAEGQHARVDEVEAGAVGVRVRGREGFGEGVGPFFFDVVDLELAVGGDPDRLHGGEVDAGDGGAGVLVGEVNGPDAGAGSEVEDGVGGGGERGEVEIPV